MMERYHSCGKVRLGRNSRRDNREAGFALLIALGLMSFLLLSVLAFSSLVHVEFRTAELGRERAVAREHARMSLLIALGELQKQAGPDQRVTAPAALLGEVVDPSKQRLTGVWRTQENTGSGPAWMVSYPRDEVEDFDPNTPYLERDTVELLGAGTLGPGADGADRQRAHRVAIPVGGGLAAGHYAWWISDEGVKVSLAKWNRQDALAASPALSATEASRLRQLTPGRARSEWLFADWDGSAADSGWDELREELARTQSWRQMELVDGFGRESIKRNFHRATWNAFGVLADTGDGGLMRDLSYPGVSAFPDPLADHPSLRRWVEHRLSPEDTLTLQGISAEEAVEGAPAFTIPLVMAEFALYVGFFRTAARADTLRAQVALRADLWNPYSFPVGSNPRGTPDLVIIIEGLPVHQVYWETARNTPGELSGSFSVDLQQIALSNRDGRPVSLDRFEVDLFSNMAVGEVRTIVERAEGPLNLAIDGDATPNTIRDDFIWTEAPQSRLTVRVETMDGQLLQVFEAVPVDSFSTEVFAHNLVSRSSPSYSDYQFVYHFKYYDEVLNVSPGQLSDLELWTSVVDPRDVRMDMGARDILEELIFVNDPAMASVDNTLFLGRPEFFYGGSGTTQRNFHRFFDIPSAPPVSVGALQHLQIIGTGPYSVGNPWGGPWNSVFDRYFFSTLPASGDTWRPDTVFDSERPSLGRQPLPNIHLRPVAMPGRPLTLESLRTPYSSSQLLVEGAFNIHALDVEVWMAVLGGLHLTDWRYRLNETGFNADPVTRPHVKNAVFRHGFGADRHFTHPFHTRFADYPEISQAQKRTFYKDHWQPDWGVAYTLGMRELRDGSNPEGINDLRDLATELVAALRERGRPFGSLGEWANSGLIQEAIDRTRINTVDARTFVEAEADIFNRFPRNSPSTVTQADILQLIAPLARARSDTFLIRAYGDHYNPVTGETTARVWCEARVQRLPAPVEGGEATEDFMDPPGSFGRRFVITDFRWLEEDEV